MQSAERTARGQDLRDWIAHMQRAGELLTIKGADREREIGGIVEEGWPSTAHVADPKLFFNATTDEELSTNVSRMIESVTACLDLGRLRSSTMSEYLIAPVG